MFQGLEKGRDVFSKPLKTPFVFQTNDDLRSHMRDWQFAEAQTELAALGATVLITNASPTTAVLGFMCGTAWPTLPGGKPDFAGMTSEQRVAYDKWRLKRIYG